MKVIRVPYKNGRVADEYFLELVGYMSYDKFRRRIDAINDALIRHGVSRGLLMLPVLLAWLTIVIVIPVSIKRETDSRSKNSFNPLVSAMLVIFFSVVAAGATVITIVTKANHRKMAALHELLASFNAEDNPVHVNWRILNDSDGTADYIKSAEKRLVIEVGVIRPMLEVAIGDSAMHELSLDVTPSHTPLSPPPPYEVAFKDPPPALTPVWRTPDGSTTLPSTPASTLTSRMSSITSYIVV